MRSRLNTPELVAALARLRHVQRHECVVGWDGAGSEEAIHRFELVRAATGRVDDRSRALAARPRRCSRLESVRLVVFASGQRDEYALCLREDPGRICLANPAGYAPPLPLAGRHL